MRIRLLSEHYGPGFSHVAGAVTNFPDDQAQALIDAGKAELAPEVPPVDEPTEQENGEQSPPNDPPKKKGK